MLPVLTRLRLLEASATLTTSQFSLARTQYPAACRWMLPFQVARAATSPRGLKSNAVPALRVK